MDGVLEEDNGDRNGDAEIDLDGEGGVKEVLEKDSGVLEGAIQELRGLL